MHISLYPLSFCLVIKKNGRKKRFRLMDSFVSWLFDNAESNSAEPSSSITLSRVVACFFLGKQIMENVRIKNLSCISFLSK